MRYLRSHESPSFDGAARLHRGNVLLRNHFLPVVAPSRQGGMGGAAELRLWSPPPCRLPGRRHRVRESRPLHRQSAPDSDLARPPHPSVAPSDGQPCSRVPLSAPDHAYELRRDKVRRAAPPGGSLETRHPLCLPDQSVDLALHPARLLPGPAPSTAGAGPRGELFNRHAVHHRGYLQYRRRSQGPESARIHRGALLPEAEGRAVRHSGRAVPRDYSGPAGLDPVSRVPGAGPAIHSPHVSFRRHLLREPLRVLRPVHQARPLSPADHRPPDRLLRPRLPAARRLRPELGPTLGLRRRASPGRGIPSVALPEAGGLAGQFLAGPQVHHGGGRQVLPLVPPERYQRAGIDRSGGRRNFGHLPRPHPDRPRSWGTGAGGVQSRPGGFNPVPSGSPRPHPTRPESQQDAVLQRRRGVGGLPGRRLLLHVGEHAPATEKTGTGNTGQGAGPARQPLRAEGAARPDQPAFPFQRPQRHRRIDPQGPFAGGQDGGAARGGLPLHAAALRE